jgi:hypothetical protein
MSYVLGGEQFETKSAIAERVQDIFFNTDEGCALVGEDLEFVKDLVKLHPDAEEKLKYGVRNILVLRNFGGSKGFAIKNMRGTVEEFSYRKCLASKGSTKRGELARALRFAILGQVTDTKAKAFYESPVLLCPFTKEEITWETCHVDHAPPATFNFLVDEFLKQEGLTVQQVEVIDTKRPADPRRLKSRVLEERWVTFHLERASLRVVSERANLSIIPTQAL